MTKKQILRSIAFLLVVCVALVVLCDLFELENTTNYHRRFTTFRNLSENTIDAVWIGTSGVDRYWIAAQAYEEYGMTVYPLSVDEMPIWLFINVIEEAYTYQDPELIIIDLRAFGQSNDDAKRLDTRARRVLDSMDFFSVNRWKAAFKAMDVIHSAFEDEPAFNLSMLLPYINYHSKWSEDDFTFKKNLGDNEHLYMGFYMDSKLTPDKEEQSPVVYDSEYMEEMDPVSEEALHELLQYVQANDLNVLFVDTPQFKSASEMGRANAVYQILDEYGVDYINFCMTDEEGNFTNISDFDLGNDFYNDGHVNYYGAVKFTAVMAEYLDDNYNFEDHRSDEAVTEDWDGIYKKIQKKIASWEE